MNRNRILFIGLVLIAAFLFSNHLTAPFNRTNQGWNGGHYGLAARNFLRYGYAQLGFMHCVEPGAVVSHPALYLRHPPLTSLLASVSMRLLGEREAWVRLPSYLLSVATVPLLFLWLLRVFQGRSLLAAGAVVTAMAAPIWGFYAHHVEPLGPGVLFSIVGSLLFADRWFEKRRSHDLLGCLLFLTFGFLTDWPAFYVPGFLGLLCLIGRGRPGVRWSLVYWGFALACGIGILLWIRHVGEPSGLGLRHLRSSALHRIGWMGSFTDDSGIQIGVGQFFSWLGTLHQRMFLVPVSVLGGIASLVLVARFVRGRDTCREALWLVPLAVGLLHVLVFPQGAYQHEYWQFFLSVGLAIPPFAVAFAWTRHRPRKFVDSSVLLLSVAVLVFGASRVQELWSREDNGIANEKAIGEVLRERLEPDEILVSNGPRSLTFAIVFYADRKYVTAHNPEALAAIAASLQEHIGGLLLIDQDVEAFREAIEALGWEGPTSAAGYSFWDARP